MQKHQLLTLSGLASVILLVIAFVGLSGSTPGSAESGAAIKTFYVDHHAGQETASYVIALAIPFLVIFASTVRSALVESSDGKNTLWMNIFFGGTLIAAAGFLSAASLHLALTSSTKNLSTGTMQALNAIDNNFHLAFTGGLGVMLLGAAGGMIPARNGIRWLGWIALSLGVLMFTPLGLIAFVGSGLWIALTSVAMTMRPKRAPRAGLSERVATT